jgi:signal transduction histidine kinase
MSSKSKELTPKIIIIDDQKAIHADFQKILGRQTEVNPLKDIENELFDDEKVSSTDNFDSNYDLHFALQGEQGYSMVKKAKEDKAPFRLAFIDMRMPPGWDGLKTADQILKCDENIQIVICTAYSDYSWDDIVEKIGITDRLLILKKPFDKIEVVQIALNLTKKWEHLITSSLKLYELENMVQKRTEHIKLIERQSYQTSKLNALGCLSSGLAHELNNPLAILLGYSEQLQDIKVSNSKDQEVIDEVMDVFVTTITRMSSIVSDLKSLTDSNIHGEDFSELNKTLNFTLDFFKTESVDKGVKIIRTFSDKEILVNGNGSVLIEVFTNLFLNAREAAENSSEKTVEIMSTVSGNQAKISFKDTGSGVPEEIKDKIYNPFFTTKDPDKGTGLGLSTVYTSLKKVGGTIALDETYRDGAMFVVTLPISK